jgi:hypothetical protein
MKNHVAVLLAILMIVANEGRAQVRHTKPRPDSSLLKSRSPARHEHGPPPTPLGIAFGTDIETVKTRIKHFGIKLKNDYGPPLICEGGRIGIEGFNLESALFAFTARGQGDGLDYARLRISLSSYNGIAIDTLLKYSLVSRYGTPDIDTIETYRSFSKGQENEALWHSDIRMNTTWKWYEVGDLAYYISLDLVFDHDEQKPVLTLLYCEVQGWWSMLHSDF